jgi:hypothetical protein
MANWSRGYHTEAINTPIVEVVPPYENLIPRLEFLEYEVDTTEHTLTVLRACGMTNVSEYTQESQNQIAIDNPAPGKAILTGDPEELANLDWVAWQQSDGEFVAQQVTSLSGTKIALQNNLAKDVIRGAPLFAFYEVARATHWQTKLRVSADRKVECRVQGGLALQQAHKAGARSGSGDALLIHINNVTAAGKLIQAWGNYADADNVLAG